MLAAMTSSGGPGRRAALERACDEHAALDEGTPALRRGAEPEQTNGDADRQHHQPGAQHGKGHRAERTMMGGALQQGTEQ